MKRSTMVVLQLIWVILLFASTAFSSEADDPAGTAAQPLSLAEAIAHALAANPQIQAARFQHQAAATQFTQARSGLLPQVNVSESFNRTTNPMWAFGTKLNQGQIEQQDFDPDRLNDPDAVNNYKTAINLAWPLYDGGRTLSGMRQSRKQAQAAQLILESTRQQVIANTAKAYMGLLLARENLGVVHQALETATAHLDLVQSRFQGGFVVKSDLLRAQVRIAELEQERLQAESQIHVAQARLNAAMGRASDDLLELTTPLTTANPPSGSADDWIATALATRPDLKQLHLQEQMAADEVDKSRAGHLPDLSLMGSYEIDSEDFSDSGDSYTVGAVLSVNLFSGQRISARMEETRAALRQIKATRQAILLDVRVEAKAAYLQSQSAWQRIHVATTAKAQSAEGLRIVRNRYQNGLLTIVALLDAAVADQEAQTRHFKALHDYQVARIDLALAAGTIDRDFQ